MEGLKNIVVLKNLPSNIIEEAFVVVKQNLKIDNINKESTNSEKEENYIIKEAQMVISDYLKNVENINEEQKIKKLEDKYKKLKAFSVWLALVAILGGIINFF